MKIRKTDFYVLLILLFPICNILGGIAGYYDELIGIFGIGSIAIRIIKKRLDKLERNITIILSVISIIGIVSNLFSGLIGNIFPILIDILWLWKIYVIFLLFRNIAKDRFIESALRKLYKVSKIGIIAISMIAIIGEIIDIGVIDHSKDAILGFGAYSFFWQNAIQTGWLLFGFLLIIALYCPDNKIFYKYLFISLIPILLTFSSLVYCWVFVEISLLIMIKENSKFHLWYIVFLAIGVGLFAINDLRVYFLADSVRMTFIRYAIVTANTFFPLGSGFATYGSEMAARYYSPLYSKYGWENLWALGRNGKYLNDNFIASIIGQFGWIGFVFYLILLYRLFSYFNTKKLNKIQRVTSVSTVITLAVVMIGSASAKSIMAGFVLATLGLYDAYRRSEYVDNV